MATHKTEKAEALFAELAAEFINRESAGQSLITVTHAQETNRGHNVTIYFTVLPQHKEPAALDFLSRKKREFGTYVKKHAKMRMLPSITFAVDFGEKNRQRMDELSRAEAERNEQPEKTA